MWGGWAERKDGGGLGDKGRGVGVGYGGGIGGTNAK